MKIFLKWTLAVMVACSALQITAQQVCQAHFTFQANPNSTIVTFTNTSTSPDTGVVVYYTWQFGDQQTSYDTNPVHAYVLPNVYNVCLSIYVYRDQQLECHDSICQQVSVGGSVCGNLHASFLDTVNGTTVLLSSTTTGTGINTSYQWWMDGQIIDYINPNISFAFLNAPPGTHDFCLYVYSGENTLCDSSCHTITIHNPCPPINGEWTYSQAAPYDTIHFTSTVDSSNWGNLWIFGDQSTSPSTSPNPVHYYAQSQNYTVCRVVLFGNECRDTICQNITVRNYCDGINPGWKDSVLTGNTVAFTAFDTVAPLYRDWSFGDGQYGYGIDATHSYSTANTYHVCLFTYVPGACTDSSCSNITVGNVACNGLTGYWLDSAISSNTFKFAALDTNSLAHHIWSFGDGTPDVNVRDTTHTFAGPNNYNVCLYVYLPGTNCPTDSLCRTVTVNGCGTPSFQYYIYSGNQIHAYSNSTGTTSNTNYGWTLKNAQGYIIQTQLNDTNNLRSIPLLNGTYQLCLTLYNGTARCDSSCQYITIYNPCVLLNGDWTWNQQTGTGDSIEFHSAVDSSTWTYQWIFGDGTSSSYPNVIHHYAQPGTYTVCHIVKVTSVGCADTICKQVIVTGPPHCGTASYNYYIYSLNSIHAFSNSTGVDTSTIYAWYLWSANGNLIQSQSGHVNYIASQVLGNGTYTLCLYLFTANQILCDSACQNITIDSSSACNGITASWTHTTLQNGNVSFTAADTSTSVHHIWNFGDGTYSSDINPTHAYANSGLYRVCLYVYIPGSNCVDSVCDNIQVNASTCHAYFTYQSDYPPYNQVQFTNYSTSADTIISYHWTFGDSTSNDFINGTHIYPQSGTWLTCLTITTRHGCTSTYCDSVNVQYNACSGLTASWSSNVLPNGNIHFTPVDTSTSIHHIWTFGDGNYSTNVDPVHAYAQPGSYHVCLLVYVPGSTCVDSSCTEIQVSASECNASFSYQSYYPPYNAVHFTNLSTSNDSIISYQWSFGDNTGGDFANGNHTFPHSGEWLVCLTITSANGCASTYCDSINVAFDPCYGFNASWTYTYNQGGGVHFSGNPAPNSNAFNLWYFGDGTYSTQSDPTHYYTGPGEYDVCHIIGVAGSCADTLCQTIQGTGTGSTCHANFTFDVDTSLNKVYFTNTSTSSDSIISYTWDFEDGAGSSDKNPVHQYNAAGTYNVCLTITSISGCTNTFCDTIRLGHSYSNCNASFTWTFDTCQVVAFTNTSTGASTGHYWNFGDGSATDTSLNPIHIFPVGTWEVHLTVYNTAANCYASFEANITVNSCGILGNDTICGLVFNDSNGNGVQNTNEPGIANAEIHIGSFVVHADSTGHYVAVVPPGTYTIYYCAPPDYTFTIPVNSIYHSNTSTCAVYDAVQITGGSNCGFNFGIQLNNVTICGTVYFDANDNQVQDQNESGIASAQVTFIGADSAVYTVYTDQYGHYCAVLPTGTYVITASSNTYHDGVVTPGSITINATANGQTYGDNNFGIYIQPGSCNLKIIVVPNTTITPGYPAWYYLQVCNIGTNVTSGTVNLFYDPGLTYNYSLPVPASANSSTYTVSWDLNNLLPGDCQYYWVSLTADSNLTTGQFIFTLADVTTTGCNDVDLSNNIDTLHQNVTASWDPNNKTVSPTGVGADGNIKGSETLTYTLNFQNTGNAPAVNIVIHDTISQNLNLATFKMLGASHPYTMQISGRTAVWKFNNIMLPDSSVDQQASHGFVSFSIVPEQGLAQGTQITNTGAIYFDYNAGVSTNTTLNTIDYSLSVNDVTAGNVIITLQPNPFAQYTTIRIDGAEGPYEFKVYDMLGQIINDRVTGDNIFNFNRGELAAGMYMYEVLQKGKVIGKGKMIAQ